MSKQKLADMVMQKMQEKKEREEKNRPHRQVLQLLVQFEVEDYNRLQGEIDQLTSQLSSEQQLLDRLIEFNQEFQNTGKKEYPRIIVKPEFIGSEHVQPMVKEFYRKASSTFLREELLRKKHYEADTHQFELLQGLLEALKEKENNVRTQQQNEHKVLNDKRVRNLKQDLRLRAIKDEQARISREIEQEKLKYRDLLTEYDLKKTNLHKREQWAQQLIILVQKQKELIERTYNPVTYREHLKKIFNIRTKNQAIQKHLLEATKKVEKVDDLAQKKAQFLEKNDKLFIQGKCSDSPSKKKRFSLGTLEREKKIAPKHNSLLFNLKKSILGEVAQTPKKQRAHSKAMSTNKSFSTSIGRTTASSMKNLLGESAGERRGFSFTSQLKRDKSSVKAAQLFT